MPSTAPSGSAASVYRARALKFIVLAGMIPAIMTNLIAPMNWVPAFWLCLGSCSPVRLLEPIWWDTGPTGYSAVATLLLVTGLLLAGQARAPRALISLTPYVFFLLRDRLDPAIDDMVSSLGLMTPPDCPDGQSGCHVGTWLHMGEWLYNVSCSILFVTFIFSRGHFVRTWAFALLIVVLLGLLYYEPDFGMTEFLFFTSSVVGFRMIFLFLRTNVDDFIRLGWIRTGVLLGKSFVLLTPIWLLVYGGFWVQSTIADAVADEAYQERPLCTAHILRRAAEGGTFEAAFEAEFIDAEALICPPLGGAPHPDDIKNAPLTPEEREEAKAREAARAQDLEAITKQVAHLEKFFSAIATENPCPIAGHSTQAMIETDLCLYGELMHAGRQAALKDALAKQYQNTKRTEDEINRDIETAMKTAVPNISIPHRYKCGFPWLPCEIGKTAKWSAETGINRGMGRLRRAAEREAQGHVNAVKNGADDATALAQRNAAAIAEAMRRTTQSALKNAFDVMGIIDHALFILLCLMIVKAVLFVFARVAYSSVDRETSITLAAPTEPLPTGRIVNCGKRFDLPAGSRFFYSKRAQMEGIAPKLAFPPPQPFACLLSRVWGGAYFLSDANLRPDGREAVFKTGNIREFVEFRLEPGEEVLFRFRDFIAIEDSVRLSTFVSFRLSTLLLGRILFRRATGPGRLLLRTPGPAEVDRATDTHLSKPIHRLVAWNRASRFKLDVEHGMLDIYFNTVHLRKDADDLVVFVAESDERKTYGTGAARFIKHFLLPI